MNTNTIFPKWLQELKRFQALKSELFLYGNVYDCYYFPKNYQENSSSGTYEFTKRKNLKDLLHDYFDSQGFEIFCYFDVIDGLEIASKDDAINENSIVDALRLPKSNSESYLKNAKVGKLEDAVGFYRALIGNSTKLSVGVVNFASRITSNPNSLEDDAKVVFLKILKSAQESRIIAGKNGLRNLLIFVCDKLNDVPAWLLLENPLTKGIEIQKPNREERLRFFESRSKFFYSEGSEPNWLELQKKIPDLTEDFTNLDLENLITISVQEKLHINRIKEIIELFKYGTRENPWEIIEDERVANAAAKLSERIQGQPLAIEKAVEIICRSKLGLDSVDKKRPSSKPKGVLFFAGPTGTGKTELAKSLAELIFNDEDALIRFDMSEYNDSNSDVKLIGSPPGYVGYEEGGQLTDAIRKKPFSIVLFDEIEKAHPKVFDKFLQILDDGRLTDGKGETVYFSQALIIFTSNLGVFKEDENGRRIPNIEFGEDYKSIEFKIKSEIKNFFGTSLNRPEILNRFGDNFVVFDFIRPSVGQIIVRNILTTIKNNLRQGRNISFEFGEEFVTEFLKTCALDNLEMGGRGIVNRVETYIKNGLTKFMFATGKIENCTINAIIRDGAVIFQ